MPTAKQAWKKRIDGAFAGTFLDPVSGRIVCKVYRERLRAIWCLAPNGKTAWERVFDAEELNHYFPYRGSIYLDGTAARRLNVETGEIVVVREFGSEVWVRPPISSGPVYEASTSLLGLHPETLDTMWEWPNPNFHAHEGQLCRYDVDAGVLYLVDLQTFQERQMRCPKTIGLHGHGNDLLCQFNERERFAVSATTGEIVWQREEAQEGFHGTWPGDTVFEGEVAYCGGRALSAYDLRTGALLWRQTVEGNPGALRVSEGRLYARTKGGIIYMLDAMTGEVLVRHDLKVEPMAIASLPPNRIVVGTYKVIYCLEVS